MEKSLDAMKAITTHNSAYARSLLEASLDPLFTISIDGKIMDMNHATLRMTGLSREQLSGTDFFYYFTDPESAREVYQDVFEKGFVTDFPLTIRDAKQTEVLFNGSVFRDEGDKVLGAVVVARDISGQKKIEKELTEAIIFSELATEIAEEAQAKAEKAMKVAEDAMNAKQQFLSNMSHEIRTPMSAIIGFTKIMLKSDLSEKQQEYLTAIKVSGEALIVLINDILDLAKVDEGKMTFEQTTFNLTTSIATMLHLFEAKVHEKNLSIVKEIDTNIPEYLIGDPIRLRQIILNLVSNAIKFTDAGGVTVRIRLLKNDEKSVQIEFSVLDTGIGIAEENFENIFENFQQASKGTARIYGGTGLGLAIVKKLVEAQNGSINVQSIPGKGSNFSFVLTFNKTKAHEYSDSNVREDEIVPKHVKVLVVEDIAINQLLVKTLLDEFGFESEYASNGRIALDLLSKDAENKQPFEIILMDLHMPVMDGFETTEYIRKVVGSSIPILALSADVTTVDAAKCRAAGMNGYLTKPVDERELYYKIISLARKSISKPDVQPATVQYQSKYINLQNLNHRTRSSPKLKAEIIGLFLEQTPMLVKVMKEAFLNKDAQKLRAAVHKMIPSFFVIGMKTECESIARGILELAHRENNSEKLSSLILHLENICNRTCEDLEIIY